MQDIFYGNLKVLDSKLRSNIILPSHMEVMARRLQVTITPSFDPSLQALGYSNPSTQQNNNLSPPVHPFSSILVTEAPPVLSRTKKGLKKRYSGATMDVPISYVPTTLRCTMDDFPVDHVEKTLPYKVTTLKKEKKKWESCALLYSLSKVALVDVEKWAIGLDSNFVAETPSTSLPETFIDLTTVCVADLHPFPDLTDLVGATPGATGDSFHEDSFKDDIDYAMVMEASTSDGGGCEESDDSLGVINMLDTEAPGDGV